MTTSVTMPAMSCCAWFQPAYVAAFATPTPLPELAAMSSWRSLRIATETRLRNLSVSRWLPACRNHSIWKARRFRFPEALGLRCTPPTASMRRNSNEMPTKRCIVPRQAAEVRFASGLESRWRQKKQRRQRIELGPPFADIHGSPTSRVVQEVGLFYAEPSLRPNTASTHGIGDAINRQDVGAGPQLHAVLGRCCVDVGKCFRHDALQTTVDVVFIPEQLLQVLHPLEVGNGNPARIGQHVRNHHDSAVVQQQVGIGRGRPVRRLGYNARFHALRILHCDLVLKRCWNQNIALQLD